MTSPIIEAGDARPPWRPRWSRIGGAVIALVLLAGPWWGPSVLRRFAFFRVRRIEVHGTRTMDPSVVVQRLHVDSLTSVFADLSELARNVEGHPQIRNVIVSRRLPGTLVVTIDEIAPVALVPRRGGFQAYDSAGRALPVDPSRIPLDVPIVTQRDTGVLSLLARVRSSSPQIFSEISDVRRAAGGELIVMMGSLPVRALPEVTPDRLAEILPVTADLARRGLRAQELDLRYRHQVIARLP